MEPFYDVWLPGVRLCYQGNQEGDWVMNVGVQRCPSRLVCDRRSGLTSRVQRITLSSLLNAHLWRRLSGTFSVSYSSLVYAPGVSRRLREVKLRMAVSRKGSDTYGLLRRAVAKPVSTAMGALCTLREAARPSSPVAARCFLV